jgi:hypothetical protein
MRRTSLFVPLALAALTAVSACHQGGPELDAEAIVDGRAPADVRPDTTSDPFTVSINRARWSPRVVADTRSDFWSDVSALDIPAAEKAARSVDEKTFAFALRALMAGDPERAAIAFSSLHSRAVDELVRSRSRVGLTMALSWRSDWAALARIGPDPDSALVAADPLAAQAGVERWARALSEVGTPVIDLPEETVLPMRRSAFGTPVLTVRINGRPYEFWLDTGASMTLLSASVAVEAKVYLAAPDTLALGVISGHIPARAVLIDSLGMGPITARGLGAAVVAPGMLRLDRRVVQGRTESIPIDGVIGTDLLRYMDLVLDAGAGTITIRRPRPNPRATRNLFWVGYPVVKLVSKDGRPVVLGLDTGAEGTFATRGLLRKAPHTPVATRRMTIGGLGPQRQQTEWVARDLALSDGDYAIALRNVPIAPDQRWTFVAFDGVIGSDVALASRLHLDFVNGVFDVRPAQNNRTAGVP